MGQTTDRDAGAVTRVVRSITIATAVSAAICASGATLAQGNPSRMFGQGAPFGVGDLPPGQLRSALESLPPQAQTRALHWLQDFSFPEADVHDLHADREGGVFYSDTHVPEPVDEADPAAVEPLLQDVTAADVFMLHSKPGAPNVVHLDFDGDVVTGTAWNASAGIDSFDMPAFDQDGDSTSFSDGEISAMAAIWHRVAEDLAPFDIDVTTEAPVNGYGPKVGHILVTNRFDANGDAIYASAAGGVAYVNVWGKSTYTYYQPALVFYNHLADYAPYVGEAVSHEFGHNLGLSHDGTSTEGYYAGHGNGYTSWAPIMGVGYYTSVTQWSSGEYADANNLQDDVQIITDQLTLSADDHADDLLDQASPLVVESDGSILVTDPETDPFNAFPANKGVIETRTDVDLFWFDAGAGQVSIEVTPAWMSWYVDNHRGADLDVQAALYDADGNLVVAVEPSDETDAQIVATVDAGRYYLSVTGVGNDTLDGDYSDYGGLGMYFISGSVPVAAADTTPPTPNPMGWAIAPLASGSTAIAMTATTATDDRSGVEYLFHCVSGGQGCVDSTWQASPSYTASGLAAGTAYGFQVKARDLAGNETAFSSTTSAITDAPNAPPTAAFSESCIDLGCVFTDASADSDGSLVSWSWDFGDGATSNSQNPVHDYAVGGSYTVTLTVTDDDGASGVVSRVITVSAPAAPQAPDTLTVTDGANGSAIVTWLDKSVNETGFELEREFLHKSGNARGTTTLVPDIGGDGDTSQTQSYVDASGTGTFHYRVRAVSGSLVSNWTDWSGWVTVTDSAGAGDKPCRGNKCK